MTNTLSFAFLLFFGIPIEVGSMFTIATHLIEIVAVNDKTKTVTYVAYERLKAQ
jgi:hypothetical protein